MAATRRDGRQRLRLPHAADAVEDVHAFLYRGNREGRHGFDPQRIRAATAKAVRAFVRDSFFNGDEPPEDAAPLDDPQYVEVVGQLFLDSAHAPTSQRGKAGMPAATLWELHPVLRIRKVEVAR